MNNHNYSTKMKKFLLLIYKPIIKKEIIYHYHLILKSKQIQGKIQNYNIHMNPTLTLVHIQIIIAKVVKNVTTMNLQIIKKTKLVI